MTEHHDQDDTSADGARPQRENDGATLLPGGEPGVKDDHPVGTTTGTGAGAAIGAVIGSAVAGPAGTVVGGIIGGVVGGGAGHGIADAVTGDDDERHVHEDHLHEHDREREVVVEEPVRERPLLADDAQTGTIRDDGTLGRG